MNVSSRSSERKRGVGRQRAPGVGSFAAIKVNYLDIPVGVDVSDRQWGVNLWCTHGYGRSSEAFWDRGFEKGRSVKNKGEF